MIADIHGGRLAFPAAEIKNRIGGAPFCPWGWFRCGLPWVGWESGVGLSGCVSYYRVHRWPGPRPSILARDARQLPLPMTPGEIAEKPLDKKSPSAATNKGKPVSKIIAEHRLPQARCLFGSLVFLPPVAAEGRFERLLRQFRTINSNRTSTCQCFSTRFESKDSCANRRPACGGRGRAVCRYDTIGSMGAFPAMANPEGFRNTTALFRWRPPGDRSGKWSRRVECRSGNRKNRWRSGRAESFWR